MDLQQVKIPAGERAGLLVSLGSVAGALGVASCCALPIALAGVGLGGAWLAGLASLAPYQPVLLASTVALLGAGFILVYRRPAADATCGPGDACGAPTARRAPKIALWAAAALTVASLAAG